MIKVKLNPDEVTICQIIGRMRSLIARSAGVKDAKMGEQDGSEADVMELLQSMLSPNILTHSQILVLRQGVEVKMGFTRAIDTT